MAVELRTEIFVSMAHELACQVMAVAGRMQNLEVGEKWLSRERSAMSPELRQALSAYDLDAHAHGPFYGLGLMAYGHRWVTVDDMVRGLESMPEQDLILEAAGLGDTPGAREQLDDLVLRTAAGDKAAARLRESVIEITRLWHRDLFAPQEDKLASILERDARAKGDLARRLSPESLLEEATNGFIWVEQAGLDTSRSSPPGSCGPGPSTV